MNNKNFIEVSSWFKFLQNEICQEFIKIENEFSPNDKKGFIHKKWQPTTGNGNCEMRIMHGNVFEKVGVNISNISGVISEEFRNKIKGAEESNGKFIATGISLVAHMNSPLVPAVHMNTRFLSTSTTWFGGGMDLTPIYYSEKDAKYFHKKIKESCDQHNKNYYEKFKKIADEYFFLNHRNEPRGIGGIFYEYLDDDYEGNLSFTKSVGLTFLEIYKKIVRDNMHRKWTSYQKRYQAIKRGRYVEFNLLQDKGTKFGLMTNGNVDAILMSMPPTVEWV
ncbi:MAG: oxygen-dependent coproporphyrinogen oxidase [Anaplasmataceae bacterium]|nr:oxygen-dependent coproporphyrinogen oxidase [Anaplasmataceae bacterium]